MRLGVEATAEYLWGKWLGPEFPIRAAFTAMAGGCSTDRRSPAREWIEEAGMISRS